LAIALVMEFRSIAHFALFSFASLSSGIWLYLRNMAWTGNPVFPFLSARLSPHLVTTYALVRLRNDTEALLMHRPWQLIPFAFLAAVQKNRIGFWDFFGPTVLALAPLILLAFRKTRAWRIPILVWFLSSVGIFFSTGLPRFLLPIFPIALSSVAAGLEAASLQRWVIASRVATGLLSLSALAGAVGLAMYSQGPVIAAIGLQTRTKYLEQRAQDYEVVEAVNQLLSDRNNHQRVLVFFRHFYYLDVPYLNGNPDTSFEVDTKLLQTTKEWKKFFEQKDIGYVVRSPDYPEPIASSLCEMERNGDLVLVAQAEVENFQGKRINERRATESVIVLKVNR